MQKLLDPLQSFREEDKKQPELTDFGMGVATVLPSAFVADGIIVL